MADNLSVTPGTGEKIPTKQLTHSGDTVQAQVLILGLDDGTTLTRVTGGQKVSGNSIPVVIAGDQAQRLYNKVAFSSINAAFTTILDPVTSAISLCTIDGINALDADIELTFGSDTNPKAYIPAGAAFEESLAELGLKESQLVKVRYVTAPTSGYVVIRGVGR